MSGEHFFYTGLSTVLTFIYFRYLPRIFHVIFAGVVLLAGLILFGIVFTRFDDAFFRGVMVFGAVIDLAFAWKLFLQRGGERYKSYLRSGK